ncbi:hypothetical protein N9L49_03895 [Rhodospirillales bacterium]|nr:hypothetical protein [Rhodospirillales bacterium]
MTARDELAFNRVLREFDPNFGFSCFGFGVPRIHTTRMKSVVFGEADDVEFSFDEQKISFGRDVKLLAKLGIAQRGLRMSFSRSKWYWPDPSKKWAFDPPLLDWGKITVGFPNSDEGYKKFSGTVLRLINKITWKRTGFGLDACRWSQAGGLTRRGLGSGILIPPEETIELNKYFDDDLWDDKLKESPIRAPT